MAECLGVQVWTFKQAENCWPTDRLFTAWANTQTWGEGCHAIHSIPSCQMTVASWLLLHQPVDSCQFASYQLQECSSSLTWTLVITGPRQQLLGQPTEWPAYKFSRVDNGYLTRHKTSHRSTTWEPMIISCWTLTDLLAVLEPNSSQNV